MKDFLIRLLGWKEQEKRLYFIAGSIFVISFLCLFILCFLDNKSTLSEKLIASCTVGLLVLSVYGIVFQLSVYLKNQENIHNNTKEQ